MEKIEEITLDSESTINYNFRIGKRKEPKITFQEKVKEFNRKADKAEANGLYVSCGIVYENKTAPGEFLKEVCSVWDYED